MQRKRHPETEGQKGSQDVRHRRQEATDIPEEAECTANPGDRGSQHV